MVLLPKPAVTFLIKFKWRGGEGAVDIGGPRLHTEAIDICVSAELTTVLCCDL